MAAMSATLFLALSFTVCMKGLHACSPAVLDSSLVKVTLSSHDEPYNPGDIHFQTCSHSDSQRSVGWCPNPYDPSPNVTVNLGSFKAVHGIRFQNIHHNCDVNKQDFSRDPFLATFDLNYVIAGDPERNWVQYSEDMPALTGTGADRMFSFGEPLVTDSFMIIPKLFNMYPCFRFSVFACDATDMCSAGWCLNGGECSGKNFCTCTEGFYGERCNNSINNIEIENYGFLKITNNTLETPDGTFDVIGNVTMETNRKRDSHHHSYSHYGHAIHCQGHNSYVQYSSSHSHHYSYHHHHGKRDSHHGHHGTCMSNLGHHSHGFTTSAHVNFGHHHSSHQHHIYSSGGHLPGHQGAHCYYHNNHMHFHVTSQTHHWHVAAPCRLLSNQWHHVQTSWHPHTGVSVHVNGHHVGSSSHAQVNSKPCTQTAPLRLCNTHYTSSHTGTNTGTHTNTHTNPTTSTTSTTSRPTAHQTGNQITININIQISGLSMIPVSQNQLNIAGLKGPYTPPPPTTTPPTTVTTTQPPTTTRPRVTATTTHSGTPAGTRSPVSATTTTKATTTTTGPHRSVCYSCTSQNKIGTCQNKTRCQVGEVCTIFQDRTGYTSKCLDEQLCLDAKKLSGSSCWECCTSYLCNDHCQANANVTCADKPTCSLLMSTGFDVCKDPQKAVDICRKSCNKC